MTPEEYQRIKEAEKEHLRTLKKLKKKLREVERQKSVSQALDNIVKAPGDEIARTHDEMIDRLAMDTIEQEVRLEMALSESESSPDSTEVEKNTEADEPEKIAASDAELQRLRAQELVRQIKVQMGMPAARRKTASDTTPEEKSDTPPSGETPVDGENEVNPTSPGTLPEKTIGRIPRKKQ